MAVHNEGFRPLLVNEFAKRALKTLTENGTLLRDPEDTSMPKPGKGASRAASRQLAFGSGGCPEDPVVRVPAGCGLERCSATPDGPAVAGPLHASRTGN